MFAATSDSLISPTLRTWPEGIEVWTTTVVLALNVVLMVFALGKRSLSVSDQIVVVICYFLKDKFGKDATQRYARVMLISEVVTAATLIISIIILKSQPTSSLPLFKTACFLASDFDRFEHRTICQSHVRNHFPLADVDWRIHVLHLGDGARYFDTGSHMEGVVASTNAEFFPRLPKNATIKIQRIQF